MPIHIFNPPCPHADPVNAGLRQAGQSCGGCICVPRNWLLKCDPIAPPFDTQYGPMGGKFVLQRNVPQFWADENQACRWEFAVPGGAFAGAGIWSLEYKQGKGRWEIWADMSANIPADIVTYIVTVQTATTTWTPGTFFNCLSKNTFGIGNGGLGFPSTITVEPFWP